MRTKLHDFFDLPNDDTEVNSDVDDDESNEITLEQAEETIADYEQKLDKIKIVDDLIEADKEFDELAELATEKFKEISDLGMQVEANHAGKILGAASTLLGLAISAKSAKITKKLKVMELKMKELSTSKPAIKKSSTPPLGDQKQDVQPVTSEPVQIIDRTEMLRRITEQAASSK